MKTRRLGSLAIGMALMSSLIWVGAGSASAHTPSVSASCAGVQLRATAYDADEANRWTATVGGVTTSGTFGESLSRTIPVAQGGATTTWSAVIEASDGSYRAARSGTVGPCGKPPIPERPADTVETKQETGTPDCATFTVTTTASSRTIPFVHDEASNTWVPGTPGEWAVTRTQTREATAQECARPPAPELTEKRDVKTTPDCTTYATTIEHQVRDARFAFTKGAWEQAGFTEWRTVDTETVEATLAECPPPAKPEPIVTQESSSGQECGDSFETVSTTTTTTDHVLDTATRGWVPGEPVSVTTVVRHPVEKVECDTPVVHRTHAVLPDTGAPSWTHGLAAGVLLVCGSAILMYQRRSDAEG